MTRPRVYMAGAVDKLPDLGAGWRREVAAELQAAGCAAVWPTELLKDYSEDRGWTLEIVSGDWSRRIRNWLGWPTMYSHPLGVAMSVMERCDAVFIRWCADVGPGTRAEIAYAVAIGLPVVVWIPDHKDAKGYSTRTFYAAQLLRDALGWGPAPFWSYQLPAAVSRAHRLAKDRVAERERLRQEAGA